MLLQTVKPWISSEDIHKGSRWLLDLSTQLSSQQFSIVCLTPENTKSEWILFEAGALSKALDQSRVCPLLIGLNPADVSGPLAQFQLTHATKTDFRKLVSSINALTADPLQEAYLETLYELLWPQLEETFTAVLRENPAAATPTRKSEDLLTEVLETVRSLDRRLSDPTPPRSDALLLARANLSPALQLHYREMSGVELRRLDDQIQSILTEREQLEAIIAEDPNKAIEDGTLSMRRELLMYRQRELGQRRQDLLRRLDEVDALSERLQRAAPPTNDA